MTYHLHLHRGIYFSSLTNKPNEYILDVIHHYNFPSMWLCHLREQIKNLCISNNFLSIHSIVNILLII